MSRYQEIKKAAYACNMQLPAMGLVMFTFGNVSAADRSEGVFAIKPSGVPYNDLRIDDMIVVDFGGDVVEGNLRPSSDTNTHAELYKAWEGIGGIAHTHSTYATAWAQSLKAIPIYGTTHADHLPVDVPCAPVMSDTEIEKDYETHTGRHIIRFFEDRGLSYKEVEMTLIGNHGPFTWAQTAEKAVYNSTVLEEIAKMAYLTMGINPEAPKLKESLIQKHYFRKHGSGAYYGQKK